MKYFWKTFIALLGLVALTIACGGGGGDDGGGDSATDSNVNSTNDEGQTSDNGNDSNNTDTSTDTSTNTNTTVDPPTETAGVLAFTDTDTDYREITGTLNITKASDESEIDKYVIYFGSDATTKSGAAIHEINVTGSDVAYAPADLSIPAGVSHFLVYSSNSGGESASASSLQITETATITQQLSNDAQDTHWVPGSSANTSGSMNIGGANNDSAVLNFDQLTIPQGSTVDNATLSLTWDNPLASSAFTLQVYAHDDDDSAGCSDLASCDSLGSNLTTAFQTSLDLSNQTPAGFPYDIGTSVIGPVQEVINRPGFTDSSSISIVLTNATNTENQTLMDAENTFSSTLAVEFTYDL